MAEGSRRCWRVGGLEEGVWLEGGIGVADPN